MRQSPWPPCDMCSLPPCRSDRLWPCYVLSDVCVILLESLSLVVTDLAGEGAGVGDGVGPHRPALVANTVAVHSPGRMVDTYLTINK
eukprot:9481943-Pyramimonas_sp.AAC.1